MLNVMETLRRLTEPRSVSGNEEEIRAVLRELALPFADECSTDPMGNLILRKKGSGKRILFAAHMDSIGLMATHIEKEGYVRFGKVGGVAPADILNAPVVFQSGVRGLVSREEKAELAKLTAEDLFIDVGAGSEEEARRLVREGDVAVYASQTYQAGNRVVSPYLDNRAGCLALLMAMERMEPTDNDVYFVFTVQEEVGLRGAKTAAWTVDPEYGFAVDVTDTGDVPGLKLRNSCRLGAGAAVKIMDSSVVCHPAAVALLEKAAKERDIPVQREVLRAGGTDAGAIHVSRAGVISGGISIPCRYIHTPCEMADLSDIEACARLTAAAACASL